MIEMLVCMIVGALLWQCVTDFLGQLDSDSRILCREEVEAVCRKRK